MSLLLNREAFLILQVAPDAARASRRSNDASIIFKILSLENSLQSEYGHET
jgi:hypothetical protein